MPSLQPPGPSGLRGVGCGPQQPGCSFAIGLGYHHLALPSFSAPTAASSLRQPASFGKFSKRSFVRDGTSSESNLST